MPLSKRTCNFYNNYGIEFKNLEITYHSLNIHNIQDASLIITDSVIRSVLIQSIQTQASLDSQRSFLQCTKTYL